ncbi:MAG: DNA-directed RNA polymerase subunit beta' [Lentisphaeria bacterium]|nr:DNA-directed RNA polymerase subunit beta' [Lentisphaeria bacterium]
MIDSSYNRDAREPYQPLSQFEAVVIKVASPEVIRSWSHGEVKNPETINYRTFKPEKGGLFCEKIFGPQRDWECSCGKYKRVKNKGIICERCGVEVCHSKVRRERMGHIELAVPVSHIWFFKCMPSRIGLMLEKNARELERIIYYEVWVVTDPGDTPFQLGQIFEGLEYQQARSEYGDGFRAEMGAPAVRTLLERIDLQEECEKLKVSFANTNNKATRKKLSNRLRLVEGFIRSNSRPEWMILEVLPVIPPDLRPLVPLEGGRFASSDLNDLYRRVINRNSRLKGMLQTRTPDVIIRNEKRMLQEAVDALLDNGRHGRAVTGGPGSRPLKSLSCMLKGKQGRFRLNLLGKRVDYSGRSVIVVGPELKLMQCGLPKKMALTLFEPFIIRYLKEGGIVHTVRGAKKLIERAAAGDKVRNDEEGKKITQVWDTLEKVTKGHPVMLNRAPTLHRLSIQAFDPILIEGSAIRLHPLVCTGYNADFDGDQMAVHVPLSAAAQLECKLLMLSTNNIFSPASGKPITTPTQDITLGVYYLTRPPMMPAGVPPDTPLSGLDSETLRKLNRLGVRLFQDIHEVLFTLDSGHIRIHDAVIIPNPDYGVKVELKAANRFRGVTDSKFIITTPGRCIFNGIWDSKLGFYNTQARKKDIGRLIADAYEEIGHDDAIILLDKLKNLGYEYATVAGFSISVADVPFPETKAALVADARKEVEKIQASVKMNTISPKEGSVQIVHKWTEVTNKVADDLFAACEAENKIRINPVYAMLDSGARGSKDQIRQLAGMRGLMAKPNGDIIERPILSNFREGLSVLEYFISTHGARKGLADTALKTADSGYMTRKLVDVAQDIICRSDDCGTTNGITIRAIPGEDPKKPLLSLADRLVGRYSARNIYDTSSKDNELIIAAGEEFTPEIAKRIEDCGIDRVRIRSVLTCNIEHGVCKKCYGKNLATDRDAEVGDALGIIAAQSIGEPGTQLTMRTFHIGGVASAKTKRTEAVAEQPGKVRFENIRTVTNEKGEVLVLNRNGSIVVYDDEAVRKKEQEIIEFEKRVAAISGGVINQDFDFKSQAIEKSTVQRYPVEIGATLFCKDGDTVEAKKILAKWDSESTPIIAQEGGLVEIIDLIDNLTCKREQRRNGTEEITVLEHNDDLNPSIVIQDPKTRENIREYSLSAGMLVMVKKGQTITPGTILARTPSQQQRNNDIVGGLPRVSELFEARTPKEIAEISQIAGIVEIPKYSDKDKNHVLYVKSPDSDAAVIHKIPKGRRIVVSDGERVEKGDVLTNGAVIPQDLLRIRGAEELQHYLVDQVQGVYRGQGVEINDKHIEIIIRQMMQKVRILDKDKDGRPGQGDTNFLVGELVDRYEFERENARVVARGGRPAEAERVLQGITKASLETDSFISAASFQDTTRILTAAATLGREDVLRGFKENVITGHLIPAGTGTVKLQNLKVKLLGEELPPEMPPIEDRKDDSVPDITELDFGPDDYQPTEEDRAEFGDLEEGDSLDFPAEDILLDETELSDLSDDEFNDDSLAGDDDDGE